MSQSDIALGSMLLISKASSDMCAEHITSGKHACALEIKNLRHNLSSCVCNLYVAQKLRNSALHVHTSYTVPKIRDSALVSCCAQNPCALFVFFFFKKLLAPWQQYPSSSNNKQNSRAIRLPGLQSNRNQILSTHHESKTKNRHKENKCRNTTACTHNKKDMIIDMKIQQRMRPLQHTRHVDTESTQHSDT